MQIKNKRYKFLDGSKLKVGIVVARFNQNVTDGLLDSALAMIHKCQIKENNIKIAINPGIAQLSLPNFAEITKKIDVLILNQEEASFLTKVPFEQEKEIFSKIDEMCNGVVVMTKGGEGVTVSAATPNVGEPRPDGRDNNMYSALPPHDRVIVDTTGAGDSFASGFLSEFMKSSDIEASIQLGMANSVGCLSQIGAKNGLLKKGQEFEKVEVKKV